MPPPTSRRPRRGPTVPRVDLDALDPHDGVGPRGSGLLEDETYDRVAFRGLDLTSARAASARFLECGFEDCDLAEADLSHTRWSGTVLTRVRGAGVDLSDASLSGVLLAEPRLGAPAAFGSSWRDVTVRGGKIDFLNLRGATLREVAFEDVVLVEPDFATARLTDVTFHGCQLLAPQFSGATLSQVDLSRAQLAGPQGLTSLRGAVISRLQLIDLSDAFADQLGIRVVDPTLG